MILMNEINWGPLKEKPRMRTFYPSSVTGTNRVNPGKDTKCNERDEYAVAFLSNFSINNNFSHFLHGLLRLFCALIDGKYIIWDPRTNKFVERVKYTIWLDENFRLTDEKRSW